MASALIVKNRLIFSTYVPSAVTTASCAPVIGKTKLYKMCMPYGDVCDVSANRITDNVVTGIGGEPQLLVIKDPTDPSGYRKVLVTGTNTDGGSMLGGTGADVPTLKSNRHWREKTRNPSL